MLATRKSKRKPTGGLRHSLKRRDKTLKQLANKPILTTIAQKDEVRKNIRGKGANKKIKAVAVKMINLVVGKKTTKAELKTVKTNTSNREYARRNIITKGAILAIDLNGELKYARVTSRPGQSGIISAVLIDESEIETKEKKNKKVPQKQEPKAEAKAKETKPKADTKSKAKK